MAYLALTSIDGHTIDLNFDYVLAYEWADPQDPKPPPRITFGVPGVNQLLVKDTPGEIRALLQRTRLTSV
jgi:hypothetical protein